MNERELLVDCLRGLNRSEVIYYLTGSMASNYWGIPRTTHDYMRQWAGELRVSTELDRLLTGKVKPNHT
jgi:hypothetical protein